MVRSCRDVLLKLQVYLGLLLFVENSNPVQVKLPQREMDPPPPRQWGHPRPLLSGTPVAEPPQTHTTAVDGSSGSVAAGHGCRQLAIEDTACSLFGRPCVGCGATVAVNRSSTAHSIGPHIDHSSGDRKAGVSERGGEVDPAEGKFYCQRCWDSFNDPLRLAWHQLRRGRLEEASTAAKSVLADLKTCVQSANLSAAGEARLHGQGLFLLGSV
jgi:hypothetical protein